MIDKDRMLKNLYDNATTALYADRKKENCCGVKTNIHATVVMLFEELISAVAELEAARKEHTP